MPEYNDITIDELCKLVELAEQAASVERDVFGSYDAIPNAVEAFGVHECLMTQFAGVFGQRNE